MDEFIIFLLAGLLILGVLVGVFAIVELFKEPAEPRPIFEEKLVIKTARFAMEASNLRAQKTHSLGTIELHNGLLFGKKDYAFDLSDENIDELEIDMKVKRTNSYGKLAVKANDNVLLNDKLLLGDYSVPVDKSMFNGHVIIEIEPESSYWRIWAPTLYEVEASLDYVTHDKRTDEFIFALGNETETLKYVNIDFIFDKNIGELIIEMNGNRVFSGPADKFEEINVDASLVNKGLNVITFSAEEDSFYSGRGVVAVGYMQLVEV